MSDSLIEDVSDTAFWVATYRAMETDRPDALFRDPLASRLAGTRGRQMADAMKYSSYFHWGMVIRTCIIDDFIHLALKQGIDTVLNLGAGLDTRPYRLVLPPALRWIEVDYPKTIAYKEAKLQAEQPVCRLERVPLDLAQVEERQRFLAAIGAQSQDILVITEGVTPYLSNADVASLAHDLRAQGGIRLWIIDYYSPFLVERMRKLKVFGNSLRNAPFKFNPADWEGFFGEQGWQIKERQYQPIEGARLKRPMPMPWWFKPVYAVMTSPQKDRIQRMMGFALLEPGAG